MPLRRIALCLLSMVCLLTSVAQGQSAKVALLVGVNQYDKRGLAEKPLQFAERDVEHMALELKRHGYTVRLLKGSSTGTDRATKANIDSALQAVLKGRNANDIVLIGFAGHGAQMPLQDASGKPIKAANGKDQEDAFFCPTDAVNGDGSTMISLTGLMQTLDDRGGINLVMVDACRDNPDPTRSASRSITGNELNGRLPANTAIVFSCSAGQQAFETQDAGGGHGIFFHLVLEGFAGEAAKKNGDITWSSLTEYVRDHTNDRAKEWFPAFVSRAREGRLQTPHKLENLVSNPVLARISITPLRPQPSPTPAPAPLPVPSNFAGKVAGEVREDNGLKMKLVWCPPGTFSMGSPESDSDAQTNEKPQHSVRVSGFWMGQTEVTQAQWKSVMSTTPWSGEAYTKEGADYAASYVSWEDGQEFVKKLTTQERAAGRLLGGASYRLPTEAEWEYACRAETKTKYSFGDSDSRLSEYAWWGGLFGDGNAKTEQYAHQVAKKKANAWGLFDMHGNVYEWCEDAYDAKAYAGRTGVTVDPQGPTSSERRVLRGGSWYGSPRNARSAVRNNFVTPDLRFDYSGFRVVCVSSGVRTRNP